MRKKLFNQIHISFFYKKRVLLSIALSLVLGIACYLWENIPLAYGEWFDSLYFAERFIQKSFSPDDDAEDKGLFINVGYDKAVADIDLYDMGGLFTGRVDITDRLALDALLKRLEEDNTYLYIFLDVRFEKGITTPYDSSLFHRIERMRDLVVATHYNSSLASPLLNDKAFISDYKSTITSTGFTRYQYIQNGKPSVPLKMYKDLTGRDIRRLGILPLYLDKGLCHNALFVRIPENFSYNLSNDNNKRADANVIHQHYFDYGPQIDENFPLKEQAEGKIVIIGDFVNDMTGTYMGEQPNPYLAFLATENLMAGNHQVKLLYCILVLTFFFLEFLTMLSKKKICLTLRVAQGITHAFRKLLARTRVKKFKFNELDSTNKGRRIDTFILFAQNFFGYSCDLFIICLVFFIFFETTFSIFIPSTCFALLTVITDTWPCPQSES